MKSLNIRVAFSAIDKLTRPVNAARQSAGGLSESLKKTQSSIKDLDSQSRTFNRLRDSVQKTSRKIDDASRALEGLNQAQREGTQLTDKQKAHMAALAAKLERLNSARTQEMVKLRAASQALRSHGVSLVGSDRTIQSAIRRTEQYNQTLERERRQLAAVTQARARYDQMQQTAGKLRGGGTMAVAGATAAGYVAGRFLSPAVGFDREMSRVQALTRIDKSSADFSALRDQAKKLGAETQFTTTDAASGQAFLAMAGFTPQAIQAALPGVLNMALAGGMDLGESADISSNILSQFRLDPKEMDRVSDVLTGAFTRTNTDLQNIGEAMKYAGTGLSSLGVSVEQTTAMIGVMANVGLRGSIAGTGLQAAFSRLAAPTGRAKTALKELGVDVADATGKMRPAEEVLTELYKKISKYGDTDKLSFFKDNLLTLLRGKLQALGAEARRGIGHCQPHDISLAVKRKLRVQLNAGVNFLTFFRQLLHALRRFDLRVKRGASGERAFTDIFSTQRCHIPHCAEITAGERRKVVFHVDACAVHVRAVVCCCITKVLRANFTPVNGGTGDSNAEFLTGWFSCASHVDNPVEWFLYGHDGRA